MYTCGCVFFWAQEARCLVYWKEYVCGPGTVSFCAESEGEKRVPVQGVHCVTLQGCRVCVWGGGYVWVWVCVGVYECVGWGGRGQGPPRRGRCLP